MGNRRLTEHGWVLETIESCAAILVILEMHTITDDSSILE
jgi:hypothetical protein